MSRICSLVYVGKIGDREVDFVVLKNGETEYYAGRTHSKNRRKLAHELVSLNAINDHNSKF